MDAAHYRSQSFWHATVPDPLESRPKLSSDDQVDVAIVGAGYTGLWTAYYLKSLEPGLRVAIVEAGYESMRTGLPVDLGERFGSIY